jgi:uncharacterized membrane protein YfcA
MQLDTKDIEAIAQSRINRAEGNRQYIMAVALLAIIVGAFIAQHLYALGLTICLGGLLTFFLYMRALGKKRNTLKQRLLQEYEAEQK